MANIEFTKLTINLEIAVDSVVYRFVGEVDEDFQQQEIPRVEAKNIFLDLSKVSHFNSCGIRSWIFFVKDLAKFGKITFQGCSVATVDQINMVPDSLGDATIESLYAPYFCKSHGEMNVLLDFQEHYKEISRGQAPVQKCATCQTVLDFDALEDSYFLFAADLKILKAS